MSAVLLGLYFSSRSSWNPSALRLSIFSLILPPIYSSLKYVCLAHVHVSGHPCSVSLDVAFVVAWEERLQQRGGPYSDRTTEESAQQPGDFGVVTISWNKSFVELQRAALSNPMDNVKH